MQWEVQDGATWLPIDPATNAKFEAQYAVNPGALFRFKAQGRPYAVDFATMTQTNTYVVENVP